MDYLEQENEGDTDRQMDRQDFQRQQFEIFKHNFREAIDEHDAGEAAATLALSAELRRGAVNTTRKLQKAKQNLESCSPSAPMIACLVCGTLSILLREKMSVIVGNPALHCVRNLAKIIKHFSLQTVGNGPPGVEALQRLFSSNFEIFPRPWLFSILISPANHFRLKDAFTIQPVISRITEVNDQLVQLSKNSTEYAPENVQLPEFDQDDIELLFGNSTPQNTQLELFNQGSLKGMEWLKNFNEKITAKVTELLGAAQLLLNECEEIKQFVKDN